MPEYLKEELEILLDGKLSWARVQEIIDNPKDEDRFEKWLQILQARVSFKEKILLPLTNHLYIVQKGKDRIVKCDCGYEFGDYRVNWKLYSLVYLRATQDAIEEIYPGTEAPEAEWVNVREYCCPGCAAMLEVETLPPGVPADFEFLPDLDTFYGDWLNQPLPEKFEFIDKTSEVLAQWAKE
ncbi:MAG: acetone carboxylase subunit gamma [Dehalococcoidia bacterium]